MAKEVLLESDITAGARLIEELDKKGADVSAALWFFFLTYQSGNCCSYLLPSKRMG